MNWAAVLQAFLSFAVPQIESATDSLLLQQAAIALESWLPWILEELPDMYDQVKGIITSLKGGTYTDADLASLKAVSAAIDAKTAAAFAQADKDKA